jgi:PhnB protein
MRRAPLTWAVMRKGHNVRISPHLCFAGQCQAAFGRYQQILGGTIATMLRYGDSALAETVPAHWQDKIVHATLDLGGAELTGVDVLPGEYQRPQGFFVTISVPEVEAARVIFTALSVGGEVHLPLQATFWSVGFGVLVDRYSVPWEVNCSAIVTSA